MSDGRQAIRLDNILVPEDRIRPVDEAAAQALAALIREQGQSSPIAVYKSSAAEQPFTLIYGARRLRAMEILGAETIDAVLRAKADAAMLEVTDNLSISLLGSLEQAEHLWAYQRCWEERNGPATHGGDRRSRFHTETLIRRLHFLGKSGFYNDIAYKFGISKSSAWRLLRIANLQKPLRDALRSTEYANDQRVLLKLVRYEPMDQLRITEALKVHPDLEGVLRKPDPETGREGVGRMETGDWREKRFQEAWVDLPKDRRAAALDSAGLMVKPVPVWPALDKRSTRPIAALGNRSPLWSTMRDPYALVPKLTFQQVQAAKERYEREEDERARLATDTATKIQKVEDERRAEYSAQREKDEAKRRRLNKDGSKKSKPGRKPLTPEQKRLNFFKGSKALIPELSRVMIEHGVPYDAPAVVYLTKQSPGHQYVAATYIAHGHGHDLDDIKWKIEKEKDNASEWLRNARAQHGG